ncbi:MAG TPA: ADP-ribosylglycohydrolase family protein [Bacillota bacterium]|nr:ADP-ribosylglycohydrolase family protein [Bacillota bacterium]
MHIYYFMPKELLEREWVQAKEEGKDISGISADLDGEEALKAVDELQNRPVSKDFPFDEPDTLDDIRAKRPHHVAKPAQALNDEVLLDKILGAWLGRSSGCWLGKPWEGFGMAKGKDGIKNVLVEANRYPMNDYLDFDYSDEFMQKHQLDPSLKGYKYRDFDGMPEDDDLNYTVIGLDIIKRHGHDFTAVDVANTWMMHLPVFHTYTAERIAYKNFLNLISPPESGFYRNPYREWIGAQIRADFWGYVNPGNPERAAEYAYRDACISHTKNGIYGEMFVAAAIAAAFVEDSIEAVIEAGLNQIPENCRLAAAIREFMEFAKTEPDFEKGLEYIYEKYGFYHPVHTINNALIVVAGLVYGNLDFSKTISIAVMGGWDTDCNGATAGSILGALLGAKKIPEKWIDPINDTLYTGVQGYNKVKISDLAKETLDLIKK